MRTAGLFLLLMAIMMGCDMKNNEAEQLHENIMQYLEKQPGNYALSLLVPGENGFEVNIKEEDVFHAASTMKVPVMLEVYKRVAQGTLHLDQMVLVENTFISLADSSQYSLNKDRDTGIHLYDSLGKSVPLQSLVYDMIVYSSNLATNLIIDNVLQGGTSITKSLNEYDIEGIEVLRGVEDMKAYEAGMNNKTTAKGLTNMFLFMLTDSALDERHRKEMFSILVDQDDASMIPALLPENVRVAHKTGWINRHRHDSGIVFLNNDQWYILTVLSSDLADEKQGEATIANISKMIYNFLIER